ncbi:hypothetical protein JVU11DRAFT_5516 [Chiua virens]|nr:hypothetical protein JVU11DRAFT_5516 [Chiua virens]
MVTIRSITISPPLVNTSCAWASDEPQLTALFNCPYTGAVTTRTATLGGFNENASHTVAFLTSSLSSLNSYGYSPHPLFSYTGPGGWIRTLLRQSPSSTKPFIISITESHPSDLRLMLNAIQGLRAAQPDWASRVAVELNTSCPNISGHPPPAYDPAGPALTAFLDVLAESFWKDTSLTIGIKLPPYVVSPQMAEVVRTIAAYSRVNKQGMSVNPVAFFTCTNTLGNSLAFADQVVGSDGDGAMDAFAVPPGVGGLAGEAIHALSLGNVYTFSKLLAESEDPALRQIVVIGAGGVTSPEAVTRMHRAGAQVVGSATLLGKMGIAAFEHLAQTPSAVS